MSAGVVIAGAGQAGFQTAVSLRMEGYEDAVRLIGEEPWLPYQRPPLSKAFMAGKQEIEATTLRPETYYRDHRVDLLTGERVVAIEQASRCVVLESGSRIPYDALVLATGARNRLLPIPGAGLDGVCYLRTRDDAVEISSRLEYAQNVVVIGGGFIGLELAAAAAELGKQVVVMELQARLMSRAVAPVMSDFFRELHVRHGVRVALETTVRAIGGGLRASEVVTEDGTVYPADLVVIGIGVAPNTQLAQGVGLPVADGIVVDQYLRTADESIYAIGDCCWHPNCYAGGCTRLESVQNAVDQARFVASAIRGKSRIYDAVPWFWTDQFEAKLQMAGFAQGSDQVVTRGELESGKFSVCYFKQGRLVGLDSVNRPADHMAARKILAAGRVLTPEQAADPNLDLKAAAMA